MVDVTLLWHIDDTEISIESRFRNGFKNFEGEICILISELTTCRMLRFALKRIAHYN